MFLRPRHVAATNSTTSATPVVVGGRSPSALEDGVPVPDEAESGHRHHERRASERRRRRIRTLGPRLVTCGCYVIGLLLVYVLVFTFCRRAAMSRVISGPRPTSKFTVLVNTFRRPDQLELALRHYAKCDGVESVRVAWSEQLPPPDEASSPQFFDHPNRVIFHQYPTTSINNRFLPPENLKTNAVFVVDDDIAVPCEHLFAAFGTWERHPDTLVGFYPRTHLHRPARPGEEGDGTWEYLYFWRVVWRMQYSMVLTKAAFVHAKYLKLYSGVSGGPNEVDRKGDGVGVIEGDTQWGEEISKAMSETRDYVDANRNCEDIAMQMAVTSVSGLPPVAAFAPIVDIGLFGGISTGEGRGKWWKAPHAVKRSRCLADLHKIFCEARGATICQDVLVSTSLFAVEPSSSSQTSSPSLGGKRDENDKNDLHRLSRWSLAVRSPTIADLFSADMLLLPGKLWRWLTKDDVLGRSP